jgi:hypothetical protein
VRSTGGVDSTDTISRVGSEKGVALSSTTAEAAGDPVATAGAQAASKTAIKIRLVRNRVEGLGKRRVFIIMSL